MSFRIGAGHMGPQFSRERLRRASGTALGVSGRAAGLVQKKIQEFWLGQVAPLITVHGLPNKAAAVAGVEADPALALPGAVPGMVSEIARSAHAPAAGVFV